MNEFKINEKCSVLLAGFLVASLTYKSDENADRKKNSKLKRPDSVGSEKRGYGQWRGTRIIPEESQAEQRDVACV
jgi:hypothetical protein